MNWRKYMTKADIILIIIIAVVSVAFLALFVFMGNSQAEEEKADKIISVQIGGREVDSIPLIPENEGKVFRYKTKLGYNIVEIKNQKVHIREADCPDQLCIHQGYIDEPGEILVCLPHQMVVEIVKPEGDQNSGIDTMVR